MDREFQRAAILYNPAAGGGLQQARQQRGPHHRLLFREGIGQGRRFGGDPAARERGARDEGVVERLVQALGGGRLPQAPH